MLRLPSRLSNREFIRLVALPCLLYTLLFFGASEILENWLFHRVSEATMHFLHFFRGVGSAFFVGAVILWSLNRVRRTFEGEMDAVTSLLNLAEAGIIAFDSQFQVISMNLRAGELLGSIYSKNFQRWAESLRDRMNGKHESIECWNPMEDTLLKVVSLHSQQSGFLLLLQDITQEKNMEKQFIMAEKIAAFGRIAGGLAHETGTPLNIISGRAEILQSMPDSLCEDCRRRVQHSFDKHVSVIFQQIERISGIIQQLLAQTSEETQQPQQYGLNECVRKVVEFLEPDLAREEIKLDLHLSENLPVLNGMPDRIRLVLLHLMLNAIDAVQGRAGVLELTTLQRDSTVLLSVRDNGSGIPQENLTRIFDPFFTTKEFGKGTGLGLSVASSLIRAEGGRIEVESQVDLGTRFLITLPIEPLG